MILDKVPKRICHDSSIGSTSSGTSGIDTNCEIDSQVIVLIMPDILRTQSIIITTFGSRLGHHIDHGDIQGRIDSLLLNKTYTQPQENYKFV